MNAMKMTTLEFLEKIVRIDSYSFKIEENKAVQDVCLDYLGEELIAASFEVKYLPNPTGKFAPALYLEAKNVNTESKKVLLVGHTDIVFPNFSDFDIRIEGGRFYGPGTIDMKSGIAVMLEAVRDLFEKLGKLENISILLVAEEEQGTRIDSYTGFVEIAQDHQVALVYEAAGGMLEEPDYSKKTAVVSRKGIIVSRMSAKAAGGHSGVLRQKSQRHSAIHELLNVAGRVVSAADYEKDTTTNVGVFKGGQAFNAIAQDAMIEFDARVLNASEFERMRELYACLSDQKSDPEVELTYEEIAAVMPLPYSAQNKSLFEQAAKVASEIGIELTEEHRGGGSDANRLIGANPELAILDSMGPAGALEHTTGEFLYLNSIPSASKLSQRLIENLVSKAN
jgi:glutamate carboxypeptidase